MYSYFLLKLVQEMYHAIGIGEQFTDIEGVQQKVKSIGSVWKKKISRAIVEYAVETGTKHPESDKLNGKAFISV